MPSSILLILDSLQARAIEQLDLKNLRALAAEGSWFSVCESLAPYYPGTGMWRRWKTATISNPVMMAGTILLPDETEFIQQAFWRAKKTTAHASNVGDFTINHGFTWSFVDPTVTVGDEDTIAWAERFLRDAKPEFLRIHLQDLGKAARHCYNERGGAPWAQNIWGEGSPYVATARRVDDLVRRFVEFLKTERLWEKANLFVTADHGMAAEGRHTWWEPDAAQTPLIVTGPGVKKAARFDYAESIDIAPTICRLAEIDPPRQSQGVVLEEALKNSARTPGRALTLRQINELFYAYDGLHCRVQAAAMRNPYARNRLEILDNAWMSLRRFPEWPAFKDAKALFEHNKKILEEMTRLGNELGVG